MLGGTLGARAALWASATAEANAKAKSAASSRRRDALLSAFASVLGGFPRASPASSTVAEEAFGEREPPAPDPSSRQDS